MKILVTGGSGFIGSSLIRQLLNETSYQVLNIDCLTYAGGASTLGAYENSERYTFEQINICRRNALFRAFEKFKPHAVVHLAAETHVDRSIDHSVRFIETNVLGTHNLLEAARAYWKKLNTKDKANFRFLHVSTDEVYGDLKVSENSFSETSAYAPSSPYSASKAASDHLVRAWYRTYGLPILITNSSNNYGFYHFPEKLVPHIIVSAISGQKLPVYGDGTQVRDWLYVEDHTCALIQVLDRGKIGETYNIASGELRTNLEVIENICELLEELAPDQKSKGISYYHDLIEFVEDRPGHDLRYVIDTKKIQMELDWSAKESFSTGLRKTVLWYLENQQWWKSILNEDYQLSRKGKL